MRGKAILGRIQRVLAAIAHREVLGLMVILLMAASAWSFIEIAEEVFEGETHAFDETLLLSLRNPADHADPLGPLWLEEVMRDFSALGGLAVLTLVVLSSIGFLVLQRKRRTAAAFAIACASGLLLNIVLKRGFDRPRPDLVPHETVVYMASFPSGHAMMAALVYLTLGALLARTQPNPTLKRFFMAVVIAVTLVVGVSRVYLGAHWPTDVLAGWAAGAAWALLFWLVISVLGGGEEGPWR